MANVLIEEQSLYDIANSIRAKTNTTTLMKVADMSEAIDAITLGTDTTKGTATSDDLIFGKIAYSQHQELVGTIIDARDKDIELTYQSATSDAQNKTMDIVGKVTNLGADNNTAAIKSTAESLISIPEEVIAELYGITSDKIVVGNTILGVPGIKTDSDQGDALADDLALNKTAVVQGSLVVGTLPEKSLLDIAADSFIVTNDDINERVLIETTNTLGKNILLADAKITSKFTYSKLAEAFELTSDILLADTTFLGVKGNTANVNTSDATALASEISAGKIAYVNGRKITGTGPVTFGTEEELNANINYPENTLAIVYGTAYIGTYRLDNGQWSQIGDQSDDMLIMQVLNEVANTNDEFEGKGGTDEEINQVLDQILGGNG